MNHHSTPQTPITDGDKVALLIEEAILALDLKDALSAVGCPSFIEEAVDPAHLDNVDVCRVRAAVIDIGSEDPHNGEILGWLAHRQIPTILISDDQSVEGGSRISLFPNIVARFSKPFIAEEIVPFITTLPSLRDG